MGYLRNPNQLGATDHERAGNDGHMSEAPPIFTIGHSNRSLDEFTELLQGCGIELLVDVRAFPGSRKLPHFGQDALAAALEALSIDYLHLRDLGGRRKLDSSGPAEGAGDGWRNASFRAYAEYAQTEQYSRALDELTAQAAHRRLAIMCSEAVPWRCHRWLVSDTLVARGVSVLHVIGSGAPRQHELSPFAHVTGSRVTWPGPPSAESLRLGPVAQSIGVS
ncbi:MAG: hypothetical protein JWM25_2029 [Thermoleophilia bacterium]|nr:hypothetical protein [Thermoleophilia bacterium]MCZ4497444.1 hypothetical protein [Thermoleophilia bacterium]